MLALQAGRASGLMFRIVAEEGIYPLTSFVNFQMMSSIATKRFLLCSNHLIIIIITTYIYHALINALSAYMIHINLNTIFCTHVEHLPKQFT